MHGAQYRPTYECNRLYIKGTATDITLLFAGEPTTFQVIVHAKETGLRVAEASVVIKNADGSIQ